MKNIKRKYRFNYIKSKFKNYQTGYDSYIHPTIELLHFHLTFADSVCKCIKNSCTIFYDFIHELIISLKMKREITYIWKYDNAVTNWIKSRVKLAKHYFSKKIASSSKFEMHHYINQFYVPQKHSNHDLFDFSIYSVFHTKNISWKNKIVFMRRIFKTFWEKSTTHNQRNKMLIIVFDIFLMRMTTNICFDTTKIRLALKPLE